MLCLDAYSQKMTMTEEREGTQSQMFTLRVWIEDVGNGRTEIRGTLKHVLTGETRHFRDWSTLTTFLQQWTMAGAAIGTPSLGENDD
jgi:hypothetical protein